MRRVKASLFGLAIVLSWLPAAWAQVVTSRDKLPPEVSALEDSQAHEPLPCALHPVKPRLNFGFRFQPGYTFDSSLDPYLDGPHRWYVAFRVASENNGNPPVYFYDSIDLNPRSQAGLIGEYGGAFQTGEGRYQVNWVLIDDRGRVCRKQWTIDAHPSFGERSEKVEMPPGAVSDFSFPSIAASAPPSPSRHITILLDASLPLTRRADQTSDFWGMLISMVGSLVEQMPDAVFRVVAFDVDRQQELFRKDNFTLTDMNAVQQVANARQHWTLDYHALQDPIGGARLIRDLETQEIRKVSPSDTVIILGVPPDRPDTLPKGLIHVKTKLRFFYLKYGRPPAFPMDTFKYGPMPGEKDIVPRGRRDNPDLIEQSLKLLDGKIISILSPADFSRALATIRR